MDEFAPNAAVPADVLRLLHVLAQQSGLGLTEAETETIANLLHNHVQPEGICDMKRAAAAREAAQ